MKTTIFHSVVATMGLGFLVTSAGAVHAQAAQWPGPYLVFFEPKSSAPNGFVLYGHGPAVLKRVAEDYRTLPPGTRVRLEGYTDTVGNEQANLARSSRYANEVKANLVKAGVPAASLSVAAFGEANLLVQTADETQNPQNNRVEIKFE